MARSPGASGSRAGTPWFLSAPGLILFAVLLGVPLIMTFMLSFNRFDFTTGIQPGLTGANYLEVLSHSYLHLIFGRTFGVALLVTLICVLHWRG